MGLREDQVLRDVELPIAAPLIIAGIRNAAVAIVATATLGALVAGGGLGRYIVDGIARQEYPRLFVGALLVALLAIVRRAGVRAFERVTVISGRAPGARSDSDRAAGAAALTPGRGPARGLARHADPGSRRRRCRRT